MAGMSTSDVVTPVAERARARMAQAAAINQQMAQGVFAEQAVEVARVMLKSLRSGGKVIFFGNGGSAQDAGHLAAELMGNVSRNCVPLPGWLCTSISPPCSRTMP